MRRTYVLGFLLALLAPGCSSRHDHSRIFLRDLQIGLGELLAAEEDHFDSTGRFTTRLGHADSAGVYVVTSANATGFSATATHAGVDGVVCALFVGGAAPRFDGMSEGQPFCEQSWRGRFEIVELPYDHDVAHGEMKARLQAIVYRQQAFYRDSGYYAGRLLDSAGADTLVTIQLLSRDRNGFSAGARHKLSPATCAVFLGSAERPLNPLEEGHAGCTEPD